MPDYLIPISTSGCAPKINPTNSVCSPPEIISSIKEQLDIKDNNPKNIIKIAEQRTKCDSEKCVLSKSGLLDKKTDRLFNPDGPKNSTAWLSNTNIDQVLDRWCDKYPGQFYHINYHMRDYKKNNTELSKINWSDLAKKNYRGAFCALNTDYYAGSGEHWVAFYVDFIGHTVEYFDSAGQPPNQEFLELLTETTNALGSSYKYITVSDVQHQKGDTECGMYTLYYIISRINGHSYTDFTNQRIPDENMEKLRQYIFN